MDTRKYGLYIVKDNFAQGRVSGFMPYPTDIAAAYGFKMFVEDKEKMKLFPIPRKLELVRVCLIDQLTDRVITDGEVFDRTVCNAESVYDFINVITNSFNKTEDN